MLVEVLQTSLYEIDDRVDRDGVCSFVALVFGVGCQKHNRPTTKIASSAVEINGSVFISGHPEQAVNRVQRRTHLHESLRMIIPSHRGSYLIEGNALVSAPGAGAWLDASNDTLDFPPVTLDAIADFHLQILSTILYDAANYIL